MAPKKTKLATPKKRLMKLAGLTASVAGRYSRTRVKGLFSEEEQKASDISQMHQDVGLQITQALGELKGAAMKVGQALSQMKDMLPEEFRETLSQLQKQAPPMDYSVIYAQIKNELGQAPDSLFASFDPVPFAAASIGQVHRARTHDGEDVVVKVQYPGVEESCRSDLVHIKWILQLCGLATINKEALNLVFEEVERSLLKELNYYEEAENLTSFNRFHEHDDGIVIPHVFPALSTKRILTLSYESGDDIQTVEQSGYSQQAINTIGRRLVETIGNQIVEFHTVHSDPHPGNFAFRPDGTLVIYDFGSISRVSEETIAAYRKTISASLNRDYSLLDEALLDLGVRAPNGPAVEDAFYETCLNIFLRPMQEQEDNSETQDTEDNGLGSYDLGNYDFAHIAEEMRQHRPLFLAHWNAFQPSAETLFINRVIGGHFMTMAQLGVQISLESCLNSLFGLGNTQTRL